jgi:hypothetical protein
MGHRTPWRSASRPTGTAAKPPVSTAPPYALESSPREKSPPAAESEISTEKPQYSARYATETMRHNAAISGRRGRTESTIR